MPKQCSADGCTWNVFGKGYCKKHQYLRTDKKPKPLKRTLINKKSQKQERIDDEYCVLRVDYLIKHPFCECGCGNPSQEIHHKYGRIGKAMLDVFTWMAVATACHVYIHLNPEWAKKMGYLATQSEKDKYFNK